MSSFIKKIIIFLIIILIPLGIIFIPNNLSNFKNYINKISKTENTILNTNTITNIVETQEALPPEDTTFTMSIIGDIMCHNTQFKDAYSNGTYDFSYVFSDIENYIKNSDISIGNLETTFAGSSRGYGGYPAFNTPEALAHDLSELGIDVLTTSNNHSLDTGYPGLESTLNYLNEAQISHTGTFSSAEEQNTILIKEVNGIKIAFLSYTYGTNGIPVPTGKEYCINLIDKELILSHLEKAKLENPDLICVSMHWGNEYETSQNNTQLDLADFLFENGADIILGSHPHVLQPLEIRKISLPDGTTKDGFVIYSLGNFISGQVKENTRTSIILNLKLTKNGETNKISIDEVLYTPIYTYTSPKFKNYKILDIQKEISDYENNVNTKLPTATYNLLKKELEKVNKMYLSN